MSDHRVDLRVPSEWDVVLSPELAPLFVLDAAVLAAQRVLALCLDRSSSAPGGTDYPPTRALLDAMRTLRGHIREHRRIAEADNDCPVGDDATDEDVPEDETEGSLF
ncbi:MAG: hypothetical protein WCJ30_13455 [Deltaproteobacteria bacterium]